MKKELLDVIVLDINVEICAAQYENMFSSWSRVIFRRSDQSISLCFIPAVSVFVPASQVASGHSVRKKS